jgi:hypothetical protein
MADYMFNCRELDRLSQRWIHCFQALSLHSAKIKFPKGQWEEIPVATLEATRQATDQTSQQLGEVHQKLQQFERLFSQRVDWVLQYLWNDTTDTDLSAQQRQELLPALEAMTTLQDCQGEVVNLRRDMGVVMGHYVLAGNDALSATAKTEVDRHVEQLRLGVVSILRKLHTTAYPFEHSRGSINLAEYCLPTGANLQSIEALYSTVGELLQNYGYAFFRSAGAICDTICQVETRLGMPLMPKLDPAQLGLSVDDDNE